LGVGGINGRKIMIKMFQHNRLFRFPSASSSTLADKIHPVIVLDFNGLRNTKKQTEQADNSSPLIQDLYRLFLLTF
ncbi:hypothetical protein VU02_04965, partial [Desulfobulbus sp. N2]|nr:hypothetical protein [Desulfobulbus sp. N2]